MTMNSLQYRLMGTLAVAIGLFSLPGHAGMVVNGTRFVFAASDHAKSITVRNTGNESFLVKSQVIPDDGRELSGTVSDHPAGGSANNNPFVITPPLFLLGAGRSSQLRLECISCESLPHNRESLYRLGISAIPGGGKPSTNVVQLAVRSTFKLFYRPAGLSGEPGLAYQQLQWERHGTNVVVHNQTPYYVTLFGMNVNHKKVAESGMVAPYSSRTESWCPASGKCEIEWASLNDFGGITPSWSVSPEAVAKTGAASETKSITSIK